MIDVPRRNKNAKKGYHNGPIGQRPNKGRKVQKAPMSNFHGHPMRRY